MTEDVRAECDRLSWEAAPFVRAEREAEEALAAARVTFKAARKAAAVARAAWVDYLLAHDHKTVCLAASPGTAPGAEEEG